ncbi:MAG: ATP-binding protein [Xanthomonadales bacterium]|jgi:two-component system sensor histidine kinase BaeS|nr:ATP-binding protein [Xanthomonadales bacterium]
MRWRPRLWHRWFLLTAGMGLAIVLAMLALQEHAFRNGLLAHANRLEQARLPAIAEAAAAEYQRAGGWSTLSGRPRRWLELLESTLGDRSRPGVDPFGGPRPPRDSPPFGRHPRDDGPPDRRPPGPPFSLPNRLSLLDADGHPVAGPPPRPKATRLPITLDGRTIGFLALAPMPQLQQAADLDFAREQRLRALWLAAPLLAATLLAALLLSRMLTRRIDALAEASRALAAGDDATRVADLGRDELGELGRDFNRMAESLQQSRQARDRWIADISHELRTPLTVLQGELQALQDGIRPLDADALDSLAAEAAQLARQVEDLYALALSDRGGLAYRFEPCDLAALIGGLVARHAGAFERAGLTLVTRLCERALHPRIDPARLEQLVGNLLSNALRHTDCGGRVELDLNAGADGWHLQLDDSAPAVDPIELPKLLDRHYRGRSARGDGAGLGLAICRNIAEAHGGTLRLAASPLGGLSVRLDLPLPGART